MKKILITGADSYIGTSFEKWLKQPQFSGKYEVHTVDMRGEQWKEKHFLGYDAIFHVAGIAHADVGKVNEEQQKLYYKVNCEMAVETAKKAKNEGVKQFVYMSSIIIYGGVASLRKKRIITRETIPSPSNFYGDSKLQAEKKLGGLADDNFKVAILRPPMIYGKNCRGNYKELAQIAVKVPVFPDFNNKKSILYIGNLCEFVRLLIEKEGHGIYFPQNGTNVKTAELIKEIAGIHSKKLCLVPFFNWVIYLLSYMPGKTGGMLKKAFGTLIYDDTLNKNQEGMEYQLFDFRNSLCLTEHKKLI